MVKNVIQEPEPILRQKAKPYTKIGTAEAKKLVKDMLETMEEKQGIGIAAPQINESVQVIIVRTENGPYTLFNPKLIKTSKKKEPYEEGCLSVVGVYGLVPRYSSVEVEAQNESGETVRIKAEGYLARIFQHEIDHINGILFIDRSTKFTEGKKILDNIKSKTKLNKIL